MPASARPRVVLAATTDLSYDQRMQRIAGSLAGAGYAVLLVGWQRPASPPLPAPPELPYRQHRLRGWFQKGKLFYLEYNLRLFCFLLAQRADLWGCADLDAALPTWARARLGGQPFAYDAHELFPEVPEVVRRPRVQRFWRRVENFVVPRARLRYTVGPALARLFEQRHPGCPFGVVRNVGQTGAEGPGGSGTEEQSAADGASPSASPLAADPNPNPPRHPQPLSPSAPRPLLLYQGALNEGRGLEPLLDALPEVPAARLVVCGEGDRSAALRAQAARLGLLASGQVEFRGYVLPADLRRLTARADVGLNLLENRGLSYYYSLANKFFDYVQAGIPQVCIDFPEYEALNAEHEVAELVPDLAPATLAAALRRLLDPATGRYARLAANCRRARQVWNWQREEQVLLKLYAQVLPLPAPPAPANNPPSPQNTLGPS